MFQIDILGNNRLQITSKEGSVKKILKFTKFHSKKLHDIAISSDNTCYSLDYNSGHVVVSDDNGHVIRYFGQNELTSPYGIAVSPVNGNVYVTDAGPGSRVKIYTQHGKYIRSFGTNGKGHGEFDGIWGIAVGSDGIVFVADYHNKRIQVFNSYDKYLYSFDCQSGDGKLRYPRGIVTENDKYVYVSTGCPYSILKFESSGKFVCRIDSDEDRLDLPTGLALTDDVPCRVVVADTNNHCTKCLYSDMKTLQDEADYIPTL